MSKFCPSLWPEEQTPRELLDCDDCGLNQHGTRMVWGEGNPEAPIIVLLDNPGARENKEGHSFVCGTRQTLQKAAFDVGLQKSDIYITYILKRKPVRAYDKENVRKICMQHLKRQLKEKEPTFIFCLGNVAVQSFFDDPSAEVKSLRGQLHVVKGFQVAVAYHPLAVRRRPNLQSYFVQDWEFLAQHYFKR